MLRAHKSQLVLIDVQERLAPAIHNVEMVVMNSSILLKSSGKLGIPISATEQYPKGLGPLVPELRSFFEPHEIFEKTYFSAFGEPVFRKHIEGDRQREQIVMCGTETHICVQQTALGFREAGFDVAVVADASSSRDPQNAERAYARMMQAGIQVVTTEMVLFEWMERAGTDVFRELSKLIK